MTSENFFNKESRSITTRFTTPVEGIFLELTTSHDSGRYTFRANRVQIKDKILTFKIDRRTLTEDPSPINRTSVGTNRYSAKKMEELHDTILNSFSEERIVEAIAWAERF